MIDSLLVTLFTNTLLVLPLALLARLSGRLVKRPALTHSLWLIVLIKLVTPPLIEIPVTFPRVVRSAELQPVAAYQPPAITPRGLDAATGWPSMTPALPPGGNGPAGDPLRAAPDRIPPPPKAAPRVAGILGALWLTGALFTALLLSARLLSFRRKLACWPSASASLQREVRTLATSLGMRRVPEIRMTHRIQSPLVWASPWRCYMVLPRALLHRLRGEELRTLLLHELAHLHRGDHWVRHLELVVRALHWCNPIAWWALRELRDAEEECCDAWVISLLPQSQRAYTEALLATAEFLQTSMPPFPVAASGLGSVPELRRRLLMIVHHKTPRSLDLSGKLLVLATFASAVPLLPVLGQDASTPRATNTRAASGAAASVATAAAPSLGAPTVRAGIAVAADDSASAAAPASELEAALDLAIDLLRDRGFEPEANLLAASYRSMLQGGSGGDNATIAVGRGATGEYSATAASPRPSGRAHFGPATGPDIATASGTYTHAKPDPRDEDRAFGAAGGGARRASSAQEPSGVARYLFAEDSVSAQQAASQEKRIAQLERKVDLLLDAIQRLSPAIPTEPTVRSGAR